MASDVRYDAQIIREFANKLYSQARSIILTYTVLATLVVGFIAYAGSEAPGGFMVGGLLGALVGLVLGRQKAFALRLEAQRALCQVAVEQHSRRTVDLLESSSSDASSN